METESRFDRGLKKLYEVDGEAGKKVETSLKDISPDLLKYIVEYSFGDIYSREGSDLKSKEIAVVATLTAKGNAKPQLKVHLNGALNVGWTVNEMKEIILQMGVYSGLPTCINAMNALKEVISERLAHGINDEAGDDATNKITSDSDRYKIGSEELSKLDNMQIEKLEKAYGSFAPDLIKLIINSYADIYSRNNLDKKYRQIGTIAALSALGNAWPQLKFHISAGLNIGLSPEEIKEILILMTVYCGFPTAINGMNVLKEVLDERQELLG